MDAMPSNLKIYYLFDKPVKIDKLTDLTPLYYLIVPLAVGWVQKWGTEAAWMNLIVVILKV